MTTFVAGPLVREQINDETVASLVGDGVRIVSFVGGLTFDVDLTPETQAAVFEWMTSRNDGEQARRAELRALRDAVSTDPTVANVAALAVASARYVLGDE